MKSSVSALCVLTIIASTAVAADLDWPAWRGRNHDGKSPDSGLLKQWPDGGPKLLWKADGIGVGFSSVAVVGGRVFITGDKDGKLMIFAFTKDGKLLWKKGTDKGRGGPDGSRASPVIDKGNLYILSGNGLIGCYDAKNGRKKWSREAKNFGGSPGGWGYAESVLIYKNLAIFKPGGRLHRGPRQDQRRDCLEEEGIRRRAGIWFLHPRHVPRPADDRDWDQPRYFRGRCRQWQSALVERLVGGQHGQLPHAGI